MDIINSGTLPTPDATPEEWIQRATMMLDQAGDLTILVYETILHSAPVLLQRGSPLGLAIAALGITLAGLEKAGTAWMAAHGVEPLDLAEEQRRIARHMLERTDLPDSVRTELLAILAEGLTEVGEDWPDEVSDKEN